MAGAIPCTDGIRGRLGATLFLYVGLWLLMSTCQGWTHDDFWSQKPFHGTSRSSTSSTLVQRVVVEKGSELSGPVPLEGGCCSTSP